MALRGRPAIGGDQKALQAVAALLASGEAKTPRSAICRTVNCHEATVRRLQRKWRTQGDELLAAAKAALEQEAARKAARESRPRSSGGGYGASYSIYGGSAHSLMRAALGMDVVDPTLTERHAPMELAGQEQDLMRQSLVGINALTDYNRLERELMKPSLAELTATEALARFDIAIARDQVIADAAQALYETQSAIDRAMDPLSYAHTELERLSTYSVASFDFPGKPKWW